MILADTHSIIYLEKKQLIWTVVLMIWAFFTKLFYPQINGFFDLIFSDGKDQEFYFIFALFLFAAICFAPFVGAAKNFVESLNISLKDPRFCNKRQFIFVSSSCFLIIYLQLLFVTNFEGYLEALLYNFTELKFLKLVAISYIAFFYLKRNSSKHIAEIATISSCFFIAMYLWSLYFALGFDNGCTTVGGDPLRGGGGSQECDPGYINQKDQYGEVSKKHGLMIDAIFATELLISQITGILFAVIGYGFGKWKKFPF